MKWQEQLDPPSVNEYLGGGTETKIIAVGDDWGKVELKGLRMFSEV